MPDINIDEFCLDTLTISSPNFTIAADGGQVAGTASAKHTNWPCNIQSIVPPTTVTEYAQVNIAGPYMAIGQTVLSDLANGDFATDANGIQYEITSWDDIGGKNPVGTVFVIYLTKRMS